MFTATNNSSKKTATARPGIFNRKRPATPPISMITFFNLLSLFFCLVFCQRSTEPLEKALPEQEFTLTVESAEVTEVWLKLMVQPLDERISYLVQRGDTHTVFSGKLYNNDTLLHDFNLQPARDYEYKAYRLVDGHKLPPPVIVTTTTMDTTSHDFTWQIFEFGGEKGSSAFYDVAIIDENNIWAVGEIYTADTYTYDSLGNFIQPYNAAHWDGEKWELRRILYKGAFWTIKTVFAFSSDDVWFEAYMKWNGKNYIALEIPEIMTGFGINKTWGTSSNDFFVVGNNGQIRHYNGVSWRRIESGTTQYLQDVWGVMDQQAGKPMVIITASHPLGYGDKKIFVISQKNDLKTVSWPSQRVVMSVWADNPNILFTCGAGIFRLGSDQQWKEIGGADVIPTLTKRIRGVAENDIFIVGDFGAIAHFNGMNFKVYPEVTQALYWSCDYKNNLMIAAGMVSQKAVILRMWRQ